MSTDNLSSATKQLQIPLQDIAEIQQTMNENNDPINHDQSTTNIIINEPNANADNAINTQPQQRIDTQALTGLRGIAAVHIMIFHSLLYSKLQWNILGSVQMPLFFLISGYIFGLSDGKQKYYPTKCCTELTRFPASFATDHEHKHFDGKHYYQRRIARTLPLFYLTNLMCIPLCFSGHGWADTDISNLITVSIYTLFAVNTWFGVPKVLNGPSWFVSTIWFFYWVFPSLIPKLQIIDNVKKQKWVYYYFWIQLIVGCVLFIVTMFLVPGISFFIATFWPVSRLPVFIMGVLAGLLRNDGLGIHAKCNQFTTEQWRKATDWNGMIMVIIFIIFSIVEIVKSIGCNLWIQLGYAWWQLYLITSLTFDEGTSITYKILTSKVALYLGRISYALYLVHEPFIQYICWIVYGTLKQPDCEYDSSDQCAKEWDSYNDERLMPIWCIPILWAVSFIVAIPLNRFIEEPLRKCLRPAKK
eukprot:264246_1